MSIKIEIMRKILFLILLTLISCTSNKRTVISKQEIRHSEGYQSVEKFRGDTANYVKENFEKRKEKYIGKNIDYLFRDLEIPIYDALYTGGDRSDIIISISLFLYETRKVNYNGHKTKIYIQLTTPLNKQEFMDKRKGSPNKWCEKDFELIKDSQIADITVVNFK
jgi:hypothetical protein